MKLPDADRAVIAREKLSGYLLSPHHPIGRFKAAFFRTLGYDEYGAPTLESEIRNLLAGPAEEGEDAGYGRKYLVRGRISGPNGKSAAIVTVWIILIGETAPRFITAYPEAEPCQ